MNIKYTFITIILSLFIPTSKLNAQAYLGIKAGYSLNYLKLDLTGDFYVENKPKGGKYITLFISDTFWKINIEVAGSYIQKNHSIFRTGDYKGSYTNFINSYFQTSLAIYTPLFRKNRFRSTLKLGIFSSYWISAKFKGLIPNAFNSEIDTLNTEHNITHLVLSPFSENYKFNRKKDNRFEFGLLTGIRFSYQVVPKYLIFGDYSFFLSLSDQQKEYMIRQRSRYNHTHIFSMGICKEF